MWKKCLNLGIVAVASFAGAGVGLANAAGLFVQAELYHVSPVAMSYGVSVYGSSHLRQSGMHVLSADQLPP